MHITQKAIAENKTEIRLVIDYTDFLFNYKHFDQCFALEEWWEQTIEEWKKNYGLNVSIICLFCTRKFGSIPYKYHRHRITNNHGIVCDAEGNVFHTNSSFWNEKKDGEIIIKW